MLFIGISLNRFELGAIERGGRRDVSWPPVWNAPHLEVDVSESTARLAEVADSLHDRLESEDLRRPRWRIYCDVVSCWKELARVQGVPVHGGRSLKGGLHLPVVATGSELDLGEVGDEDEEGRRRRLHPERCESSDAIRTGRMQRARIHYLHRIIATPRVRPAQAGRTWPRGGTPAGLTRPSDAELDGPRPVEFSRSENRRPSLDRDRTAPRDQRHRWIESPEGEGASQSDDRDSTRGVTVPPPGGNSRNERRTGLKGAREGPREGGERKDLTESGEEGRERERERVEERKRNRGENRGATKTSWTVSNATEELDLDLE
ncbi:hypothetical protein MPTK2_7g08580 [Marchantia polymorpha subsp. ruderalis]